MSADFWDKRINSSDAVENSDDGTTSPAGSSEPFTDEVPMDETPFQETSMGVTDSTVEPAAVEPVDQELLHETPMVETYTNDDPMVGTTAHEAQFGETIPSAAPIATKPGVSPALLKPEESEHFRVRWNEIQGQFVDEPRSAVQQADALVSEVIEQITQMFASEHSLLEGQWKQGNDVSTEDLRKALQRYRSFFNRLVV